MMKTLAGPAAAALANALFLVPMSYFDLINTTVAAVWVVASFLAVGLVVGGAQADLNMAEVSRRD